MKAYGYHRAPKQECPWGCCTTRDGGRERDARKANDRAAKKNGRRISPRLFTQLLDQ